MKRLFRKLLVWLKIKDRAYVGYTKGGYRYIYNYVDNTINFRLQDLALKFGFSTLEGALKCDVFVEGLKEMGCDFNNLTYQASYEQHRG